MKNYFQKTKMEWVQLVLFPFKCCIFLIPLAFIVLMIGGVTTHRERLPMQLVEDQIPLMVGAHIVCIIILATGGIFAAISMRNWKLMLPGLIYAGIGLFLLAMIILPSIATN